MTNLDNLPDDIWFTLSKYIDLPTISTCLSVNKKTFEQLNKIKWNLIDEMLMFHKSFSCFPKTRDTYHEYKYCIDFVSLLYNEENKTHFKLSEDTIDIFINDINFDLLCSFQSLTPVTIEKHYSQITNLNILLRTQKLPQYLIEILVSNYTLDNSHWKSICEYQTLTVDFIQKYYPFINWHALSTNKESITIDLINQYPNQLKWTELSNLGLSEDVIESCRHKLDTFSWINITFTSKLSSRFIKKHLRNLDIMRVITCQQIDEETILYLIEKGLIAGYPEDSLWKKVSTTQTLTLGFIQEHKSKLDLNSLVRNPKIKRSHLKKVYG